MSDKELLPCPFCGANAEMLLMGSGLAPQTVGFGRHGNSIHCLNCQAMTGEFRSKMETIRKWNTRQSQPEWVSVETLPKENGYYLCTYIFDGHRFYYDRWFDLDEKNKFQHGFQTTDPIDFWMPLAPPPKPESSE